jgi:flagellar M-ring protein FliF
VPPTPETLKIIHDLVAGVTGYNLERGDQLVIETLPFESTLLLEPPVLPGAAPSPLHPAGPARLPILNRQTWIIGGVAIVVVIGALAFLLLRRKRKKAGAVSGAAELAAGDPPRAALAASKIEKQMEAELEERDALQQKSDAQMLSTLKLAPVITKKAEVLAKHLREKIAKDPDMAAHILRSWIREEEA